MLTLHRPAAPLLLVLAASSSPTRGEVFRPLPDLPGGVTETLAWGLSRDGSTVVGTAADPAGQAAVRWSLGPAIAVDPIDADASGIRPYAAFAVSADGRSVTGITGPGMRGFIWSITPNADGHRTRRLPELPGATITSTRAHDLDDTGRFVVGYAHTSDSSPANPRVRATYWDTSVTPPLARPLGEPSQANLSVSSAISISGDGALVTGDARGPGSIVPFVTGRDAPIPTSLPLTFSSTTDAIGAITRDGRVVVGGLGNRAFRFDGHLRFLDSPVPGWSGYAAAISDDARSIVGSAQGPGFGDAAAVLWDAAGLPHRLDTWLIAEHHVNLTGWSLVAATAISGDGLTIAGYGINPAGQTQAFAIQIPAPRTMCIALALLPRRTRRR